MTIIDGKKIAQEIIEGLKSRPKPEKFFAGILIGDNPASESFQKLKQKTAVELGIDYRIYNLSADLKNDCLRAEVGKIAAQKTCGGVIVQLPLPEHINKHYILNVIPREKDIDVLGERALGAFYVGRNPVLPPAVGVVEKILVSCLPAEVLTKEGHLSLVTLNVAVVGLGFLIGKPVSTWLIGKAKDIMLLDKFSDLSIVKNADVVILGAGQAGLIKPEMLKEKALIIDFGYSVDSLGKIKGDFDSEHRTLNFEQITYTPTPGGTGPILVAKLFENFYELNEKK